MLKNGNGMPKPEVALIALADVIWAISVALPPKQRVAFIRALEQQASGHDERERLVTFSGYSPRRREMSHATRLAIAFLRRILAALRAARG